MEWRSVDRASPYGPVPRSRSSGGLPRPAGGFGFLSAWLAITYMPTRNAATAMPTTIEISMSGRYFSPSAPVSGV